MEKYLKVKENAGNITDLKIELYYHLGGMNYFTGREERRGYYLSVTPVEKSRGFISYTAFTGIKQLIKEVKRKSNKAEAEAEEAAENVKDNLINYVLTKNNLQLDF